MVMSYKVGHLVVRRIVNTKTFIVQAHSFTGFSDLYDHTCHW